MRNQTFECRLTAADRYRLGEAIMLKFEIRNVGSDACRILTWNTPLDVDPLDFLTVTQDDVELEYDGRLVVRGDPAEDDYITLEPGASRSADVDISRLYPIDLPGEYTATLTTSLVNAYTITRKGEPDIENRGEYRSHPLDETKVMFVVESGGAPKTTAGQLARLAELERAGGLAVRTGSSPMIPVIIGGTKQQRADTLTAHWGVVERATNAYSALTSKSIGANPVYREWFGKDGRFVLGGGINRSTVVKHTFDLLRHLPNATFPFPTYDLTANSSKYNAYTHSNSWTISCCQGYRDAALFGKHSSKRSILTHEWTHARGGTGDYGTYGVAAAHALAINQPGQAVFCAENYEYFSESI